MKRLADKLVRLLWDLNFWMVVGTWVLAVVGYWALRSSDEGLERQLFVLQAQLDEMRYAGRAWVSMTKDSGIASLYIGDSGELRGTFRFGLQNTGKNPAVSVSINAEMSTGAVIPHGSMPAWQTAICGQPTGDLGFTMFPGAPEPLFEVQTGTTGAEFAERRSVGLLPVVAACVVYQDAVTNKMHRTPLAFQVVMRASRPGNSCCAIVPANLPINGEELVLRPWLRGNLPPS